jgi:hypothetical protein
VTQPLASISFPDAQWQWVFNGTEHGRIGPAGHRRLSLRRIGPHVGSAVKAIREIEMRSVHSR